jgi:hypothetical protein
MVVQNEAKSDGVLHKVRPKDHRANAELKNQMLAYLQKWDTQTLSAKSAILFQANHQQLSRPQGQPNWSHPYLIGTYIWGMNPITSGPIQLAARRPGWLFSVSLCLFAGCLDNFEGARIEPVKTEPTDQSVLDGRLVGSNSSSSLIGEMENPTSATLSAPQHNLEARSSVRRSFSPSDMRPPILAVQTSDSTALGVPIGNFSDQLLLMRNDGAIQRIQKPDIVQQSLLKDRFQSIDRNELAQQLRAEFGRNYFVKNEFPYLVIAKPEHINAWSQRFRSLHHSFKLYCATHGLPTREIEFPLVAVVFGSRHEFLRYTHSGGVKIPENCVGYYFSDSNRILLYESEDSSTKETQLTICHEATHQLAFNMGLHQRRASTPLWIIEGLATMFESPMLSGLQTRDGNSLWPASRKQTWQTLSNRPESIQRIVSELIHNDKAFESDFQNAYTVAWAMTTYLSQRRSKPFGPYLQKVGNLPPFEDYSASNRITDFQSAFGSDVKLFTNKMIKHLETLE